MKNNYTSMRTTILFATMFLSFLATRAQIIFTNSTLTYAQNFDSLPSVGTAGTLADLPDGWTFLEAGSSANSAFTANDGSSNSGNTYSYGAVSATDRALGELTSGSVQSTFGVQISNKTTSVITSLDFDFYAEQWRHGNTTGLTDTLLFEYSTDATDLATGTWTEAKALTIYSVNSAASAATALDGNDAANRANKKGMLSSLSIAANGSIWIRFRSKNITGSDDGLAIDDFKATATIVTGISELQSVLTLNAFPQPFSDNVTLDFSSAKEGSAHIGVYDITGREIKNVSREIVAGQNNILLSDLSFTEQVLFIRVTTATATYAVRIIHNQ